MNTTPRTAAQDLAKTIHLAIEHADVARFGDQKVFIAGLYRFVAEAWGGITWSEFRALLLEANQRRLLTLARADYARGMDAELVAASHIHDGISDFHFVLDETAR